MYKLLGLPDQRLRTLSLRLFSSKPGADPVCYLCPSLAVHRRPVSSHGQQLL